MKKLLENIEFIKRAGFSHIKVELEGDLGRLESEGCWDCDSEGYESCYDCSGEGYADSGQRTLVSDESVLVECDSCSGEGLVTCSSCDGTSRNENSYYSDEDNCRTFMQEYVGDEVANRLTYGRFYEDGSVDSEFTFTLPIEHVQDVILWKKAFVALANEIGGQLDVDGAGLHIALLPDTSDGYYPCDRGSLDHDKLMNFKAQVEKLMPALFFLASPNSRSRSMNYRMPQVSDEKYSAISYHNESCLEYRVFETCYNKPERFFDYIDTIAKTLKFYANPSLTVESIGKQFNFEMYGHDLRRFYSTPEQLRILNKTIKELKPETKSYRELKRERGMSNVTIKELKKQRSEHLLRLRNEYETYRARRESYGQTVESLRAFIRENLRTDSGATVLV